MTRILTRLALSAFVVGALAACGGGSSTPDEPVATTPPPTEPVVAPQPQEIDERVWYVYWDEIHSLTIYPQSGPIRSEEPGNSVAPFGESRSGWSVISTYWEKERMFAPHIAAATDLDDLLQRMEGLADQLVRVEESINPVYMQ